MSLIHSSLLLGAGAAAGDYQKERSLRFNSSDSAFLSRTPASTGNRRTWTWAGWVKRSALGSQQAFFSGGTPDTADFFVSFESDDTLRLNAISSGTPILQWKTSQVFRDPGSWYHIVFAVDTTQATATNRVALYVNGSQVTTFGTQTTPAQNTEFSVNATQIHGIGYRAASGGFAYFSGLLADVHFIDGQALDPSSFTEVSATTGQLIPKAYTGTFTGNSFWLKFSDNSSTTSGSNVGIGKDFSGLGNYWNSTGLSVTAGAGNDSLVDTPTSYGTDDSLGGSVRGNYATLNPLQATNATLTDGNLRATGASNNIVNAHATFGITTGKWYWEWLVITEQNNAGATPRFGVCTSELKPADNDNTNLQAWTVFSYIGGLSTSSNGTGNVGTLNGPPANWANNDIVMIAVDYDAGKLWMGRNGTWFNSWNATSGTNFVFNNLSTTKILFPFTNVGLSAVVYANFGQRQWVYQAPAGFKALCDTNLPSPSIAKPNTVMDVKLYSGNNSTQTIPLDFNPDFIWLKCRNSARSHRLIDTVRGLNYQLWSDLTTGGNTYDATSYVSSVTSTSSSGFVVDNSGSDQYNTSGETYVAWAWDAGTSTVTNTQGSITSQVRANASAGFSIVTWNGNGNATIGHGLGVAPQFIICKQRTGTGDWQVGHYSLGWTKRLGLNLTTAEQTTVSAWNNTVPTSTVFSVGNTSNFGGDIVSYCFAPVVGYGNGLSYVGNGSTDGPFCYLGFLPKLILIKCSSTTGNWVLLDTKREGYNVDNDPLFPNLSDAEAATDLLDITSNGFKIRSTNADVNASAATYIVYAWASNPFQYSRAR